jgi:hypothetical protein
VRFPNAIFQLLGAGKKGVIMERTDGQMVVPAVLQGQLELPAPILENQPSVSGNKDISFAEILTLNRAGVQVATFTDGLASLRAGIWRIRGMFAMLFTGTTNLANITQFGLRIGGTSGPPIAAWVVLPMFNTGVLQLVEFDQTVHILTDINALEITVPAIVGGDVHNIACCYQVNRLL